MFSQVYDRHEAHTVCAMLDSLGMECNIDYSMSSPGVLGDGRHSIILHGERNLLPLPGTAVQAAQEIGKLIDAGALHGPTPKKKRKWHGSQPTTNKEPALRVGARDEPRPFETQGHVAIKGVQGFGFNRDGMGHEAARL